MTVCRICKKNNPEHIIYCEEHYRCADCGEKKGLCIYGENDGVLCSQCKQKRLKNRIAEFNGNTDSEPEITCPWCGYIHRDSWEYPDSDDEFECSDCGNIFVMKREIEVTYSTCKPGR